MLTISRHARQNRTKPARAFTLVELLVVISIIGILVALLMPAINSARESGRRAVCANNVHQLALGCLALESKYQYLPGGGWGWQWAGESDRGFGAKQPGGWLFNILPFIDQSDLHDLDKGLVKPGDTTTSNQARRKLGGTQAQTPVSVFICPSRRKVQLYPYVLFGGQWVYVNIVLPTPLIARSDYAANGGSDFADSNNDYNQDLAYQFTSADWAGVSETLNSTSSPATGVIFCASQLPLSMIKDGASNTYLIGERYLNPKCYYTGTYDAAGDTCSDDDQGWDEGFDWDTVRGTGFGYVAPTDKGTPYPPAQDQSGHANNNNFSTNFGSAHAAGVNMAFCDGAVKLINYNINPTIHMQLGHRSDGEPTDASWSEAR